MITTVSVVIPVYNRVDLIDDAIRSVAEQELPAGYDLEVIVVDDGSTDGTDAQIRQWADRDSRVRYLGIGHLGTPGGVRNYGVANARGKLLAFLDSDDRWYPGKVISQVPLHASGARLSHTRERWIRDGREVSQAGQRHQREGDLFQDALTKCIIGPSTVMIDRDIFTELGGFRGDLEVAEDYEFWLRVLCHHPVAYVDEPLTEKRAGGWEQLSERYGQIEGFRIAALGDLVDSAYIRRFRSLEDHYLAVHELVRKMRVYAQGARKRGREAEATDLERRAIRYLRKLPK